MKDLDLNNLYFHFIAPNNEGDFLLKVEDTEINSKKLSDMFDGYMRLRNIDPLGYKGNENLIRKNLMMIRNNSYFINLYKKDNYYIYEGVYSNGAFSKSDIKCINFNEEDIPEQDSEVKDNV